MVWISLFNRNLLRFTYCQHVIYYTFQGKLQWIVFLMYLSYLTIKLISEFFSNIFYKWDLFNVFYLTRYYNMILFITYWQLPVSRGVEICLLGTTHIYIYVVVNIFYYHIWNYTETSQTVIWTRLLIKNTRLYSMNSSMLWSTVS